MDFKEAYKYGNNLIFTQQCPNKAAEYNSICLDALKMQIPQKIVIENWSSTYCLKCGYELSEHQGDGYYTHPDFLEMCPHCGQKIFWKYANDDDESEGENNAK